MQDKEINYDYCSNCGQPLLYPKKQCPYCDYKNIAPIRDFFNKFFNKKSKIILKKGSQENSTDIKLCNYCGSKIKITAKKCRYCKKYFDNNENVSDVQPENQTKEESNIEQNEKQNTLNNEKNMKNCSYCGKEINISAKKCKFCKEWVSDDTQAIKNQEVSCPFCSELILSTAKKCKHCGEWINKDNYKIKKSENFKLNIKLIVGSLLSIFIVISIILFKYYEHNTPPDCYSAETTDKAIEIFKENTI